MGFNEDDNESDYEFSCPKCGDSSIVVEEENGYYYISRCHKCGYNKNKEN